MKYVAEAFSLILSMVMLLFLCIAVLSVSADVAAAKEYKAEVVAEIENSNFNPIVIEACRQQAAERGYQLEVATESYGDRIPGLTAQVKLTYEYKIPFLGVSQQRVTRGVAR